MEHKQKRIMKCSICQSTEHNKTTCPQRLINDTFIREEQDYIEETIEISDNKEANNSTLYLHLQRMPGNRVNTIIKGIENGADMHSICKEFKKKLGVGGFVKNKDIYFQGNHRQILQKILSERGFKIKLSGG